MNKMGTETECPKCGGKICIRRYRKEDDSIESFCMCGYSVKEHPRDYVAFEETAYVGVGAGIITRYYAKDDEYGHQCLAIEQGENIVLLRKSEAVKHIPRLAERYAK